MNRLTPLPRLLFFSLTLLLISFGGCKKTGTVINDPMNPYYNDGSLSANVAGSNWQAKSVYAVDSSNMIFIVAGSSSTNSNFPVILIAFPDNVSQGSSINFNIAQQSMLQFYEDATTVYWADPVMGGSGTVTISKLNKASKRVEGSFSATLKSSTPGVASKSLTGGQFAIDYR